MLFPQTAFTAVLAAVGALALLLPVLVAWRIRSRRRRRDQQAELAREQSTWDEISNSRLQG